ncbi:MAG: HEAT repeat domain-containing protein [Treponema sp.]|jgi:HEAT repeat protein|nr:HEAT repeat domain-containing protein [Treponema sp.]
MKYTTSTACSLTTSSGVLFFLFWYCFCGMLLPANLAFAAESAVTKSEEQQRMDTIRYGTETEIAALIQTLKSERSSNEASSQSKSENNLDDELIALTRNTRNQHILSGVLTFFGDRNKKGLEQRAVKAIEERDDEAFETVMAAIDYLGKVKALDALGPLEQLLDAQEAQFMDVAFRALGRVASGGSTKNKDDTAAYLIDFYTYENPPDQNRRELIVALGETGSQTGVSLLSEIAGNSQERGVLRMAALEGLAKIGDSSGLDGILEALSSTDPNVRSTAVAALGPFSGKSVDDAILESFRDSYYRTRIGAASAAGTRKLTAAIPYLQYRAERDEVPNVRDEAIKALGAIGNAEAKLVLEELFTERKHASRIRIRAAEMLIANDPGTYLEKVIVELDEAKKAKQTSLYNSFLGVLSRAKTGKIETQVRRFLDSGGVIEKSTALDMISLNELRSFAPELRTLRDDPKNTSLARKARNTLEHMGLE